MRLSKIKLAGFKSFVDPTSIPLPGNLVAVVGPNGCGKSNIIDAVRWVMGESSAKHLRGESITDVIFNGSTARKPVGQASIELVFDNRDGTLGGQYAQYNEISVKRVVTRDGVSSYYLNGTRCRRRDITDIFLGTGLGPRSYAIIEQGTISRLIEAKPEEMRVFLEEAAGISKYKERRRETENRIRHTRDNLDRLSDLREELGKQLSHLQRQARTAERYKVLKEEERLLKGQLQALRWQTLDKQFNEREGIIREHETEREAEVAKLRSTEAEIEGLREQHVEATEAFNGVQSRFYAQGAEIAKLEQTIQHTRERRRQMETDLNQLESSWVELQRHQQDDQQRITELGSLLEEKSPQLEQLQDSERLAVARLQEVEASMQNWQQEWERFNGESAESTQSAQVERTRLQNLEQQLMQMQQRLNRLEEEAGRVGEGGELAAEIGQLEAQLEESQQRAAELEEQRQARIQALQQQREKNHQLTTELDTLRNQLQEKRGRQASLEALQQAALGQQGGSVNQWLEQQGLIDAKRLAQQLVVDSGWEQAVETVLGPHLEAVCVEGLAPLAESLQALDKGALTLFDTQGVMIAAEAGSLASKVKADAGILAHLNGVKVADDLHQALAMQSQLAAHESVITADGVWLGPNWLRVSKDVDEHAGVLAREQELKTLVDEVELLQEQADDLHARLETGRTALQAQEEGREQLQRDLNQVNQQASEIKAQLSGRQGRLEQARQRAQQIETELNELRQQLGENETQQEEVRSRLNQALAQSEDFAVQRETLNATREQLSETLQQARDQAQREREQTQSLAMQVQTMRTELQSIQQGQGRTQQQLEQMGSRRQELTQSLQQDDDPMSGLNEELEEQLAVRARIEEEMQGARKRLEEIDHQMRERDMTRQAAEARVQSIGTGLETLRIAWSEIKTRRQTIVEQIDEVGYTLSGLLEEMPEGAEETSWQDQVNRLGEKIQRLGPINLAAIDEYDQQSERKTYLDAQNDDLMQALETLENAIHKIDKETRTRFKETYDKVNSGLKAMFPRLFGGGHAYLELTGDDMLDAGVAVMARPPGKRNSTIHLLSGGEKALTAVALVFSIFELNPAPFCMLDEVDAPLDDANVGRFCEMVKEMSSKTQFIFITHNKITMELAQQLNGVTMKEPGVSRLVAVDVDAAAELAVANG